MLKLLITSRVRRKLIVLFIKYPDYENNIRQISKLINEDCANVYRELKSLEAADFFKTRRHKNSRVYYLNRHWPMLRELSLLVLKSQKQQKKVS